MSDKEWGGIHTESADVLVQIALAPDAKAQLGIVKEYTHRVIDFMNHVTGGKSIPMILLCPMCQSRHVDRGEFATKAHHTHACQECGMVWRPALVPTVGVQFLPGFKDPPDASRLVADGHGNEWEKCEKPDCDLHVVRPGKVQCEGCDRDLVF